ncbi:MAG: beta-N-acetylhexosaminidase [Pseudomonadota bacterium]
MDTITSPAPASLILGLSGPDLTAGERALLARVRPWGLILFARNVDTPVRLATLVADARAAIGAPVPVLIDQEGGRVARLGPPHWLAWEPVGETVRRLPAAQAHRALELRFRLIAHELLAAGIDVDCMPLLDVRQPGGDPVIGHRAFGMDAQTVAGFGRTVAEALRAGGVLPVIKHLPGHGRADVDSHLALPVVDASLDTLSAVDFAPFRALAGEALGMTAHIVYTAIDPKRCATLSPVAIRLIREALGFEGCLMTDDISMGALSGPVAARAEAALEAGCDLILHCNGDMAEMEALAEVVPPLSGPALDRATRAAAARPRPQPFDPDAALAAYRQIVGEAQLAEARSG